MASPKRRPHQWEFKVVYIEAQATVQGDGTDPKNWETTATKLSEFYTSLGADGWEDVGTHGAMNVVFKRPKK